MENRSDYVVEHVTAMSTMDAYHWLRMARDLDAGKLKGGLTDSLRGYPDLDYYPENLSLLAKLISFGSRFTDGNYYQAGLLLIPLFAGLFVFPLFLYFNKIGFGASAVLGGLIGSFSVSYYSRSHIGYLDTDMLNTFFPITISLFILLIDRNRSFRNNLLLAFAAGVTMYLFNWWYQQPVFFLVYLLAMLFYLFLLRFQWQQACALLLTFTLSSGISYVLQSFMSLQIFLDAYFFILPTGQVSWPDILTTITEAQKPGTLAQLNRIHGLLPMVLAGLVGLIYLCIARYKQIAPIAPVILLGAWSLVGPRRFTMYLAPFIGIGVGVLIEILVGQARQKLKSPPQVAPLVATALMLALFFSTTGYTAYHVIPGPTVPVPTTKAILDIKQIVPRHSAMFTWWDNGYPLMEIGEFATYHDGGSHSYSRTTLVAKAMTSPRQEEMISLLAYLEEYGFDALNTRIVDDNLTADQVMQLVFGTPRAFNGENVHVLYTEDMISKFRGISIFGTWDFQRKSSAPLTYETLHCFSRTDNVLTCKGCKIDLNRGMITDGNLHVSLKEALIVDNGYVVDRIDYGVNEGNYLQILMKNNKVFTVQVLEERLFLTNFNQQYLLGNFDKRFFKEIYNDFPVARVLQVKTAATDETIEAGTGDPNTISLLGRP
jgi:dolichyl-diphosphooligosaccharide--protein glycosyltransferase